MSIGRRASVEFVGTFWLVFGGCGSAVIAAAFPNVGIGLLGVALAFGLTVLTMAYAIGHISGCHLNPAVSVGLWAGQRFPGKDIFPYVAAQVLGAIRDRLAELLRLEPGSVNVKAKTGEGVGAIGRAEAIACQVVALIDRY